MGNNPSSTSKPPTTPSSSSSSHNNNQHDFPKPVKRDTKHPIPVQNQRVAAPPEPSLAQAQGTNSNNRPKPRPVASLNNSSASSTPASSVASVKPVDVKPRPEVRYEPTKPVAVPQPRNSPSSPRSPRSPLSDTFEAGTMAFNGTQDMYPPRPPRLPLPIEEEIHTPGSPILAPTDAGEPLEEVDTLDSDGLPTRTSGLSSTTIDDEDGEELRVDKTRPTVPTKLEWLRGGEKVYVTGTIFQWNRKTRLLPV